MGPLGPRGHARYGRLSAFMLGFACAFMSFALLAGCGASIAADAVRPPDTGGYYAGPEGGGGSLQT
ncbi:MAG: hypothetical protein FWE70_08415, partial [Oscillospiraceae bacterium]|nr:hypothetical protein [Oscillospiraceae bacterium]